MVWPGENKSRLTARKSILMIVVLSAHDALEGED